MEYKIKYLRKTRDRIPKGFLRIQETESHHSTLTLSYDLEDHLFPICQEV